MSASGVRLAVPSKGRLKEAAEAYFSRAGLTLEIAGGNRGYTGAMAGLDKVEVLFLPAGEIAEGLAAGALDLGVTGLDLLDEQDSLATGQVFVLLAMGFGAASVAVAVPDAWIDVANMDDLDEVATLFRQSHGHRMRVATKYLNLTRRYFAAHGVGDYRVVESPGATEAAPAMGAAELIVDISSTGATLEANKLKILDDGVILRSESVFASSLSAPWNEDRLAVLGQILERISAQTTGRDRRLIEAWNGGAGLSLRKIAEQVSPIEVLTEGESSLRAIVPADQVLAVAEILKETGQASVVTGKVDYIYGAGDTPLASFEEALANR